VKKLLIAVGVLLVLGVAAVVLVTANLDRIVKAAIERVGSDAMKSPVTVDSVKLSLRSGSGTIRELQVRNPEGYPPQPAVRLGEMVLAIDPASVQADKLVIRTISVTDGELFLTGGIEDNNLKKLMANLRSPASSGGADPQAPSTAESSRKLQVDELTLTDLKLNVQLELPVVGTFSTTAKMPEIKLAGLGQGPEGVTGTELGKLVMKRVLDEISPIVVQMIRQKTGQSLGNDGKKALQSLEKAAQGVGDLFKKK
jgi:hypothetical protein